MTSIWWRLLFDGASLVCFAVVGIGLWRRAYRKGALRGLADAEYAFADVIDELRADPASIADLTGSGFRAVAIHTCPPSMPFDPKLATTLPEELVKR